MNSEEFKKVVDGCIENIKKVLESKSQEYSSKDDKLHNFVEATKIMRCKTKEFALLGMLNKHLVSIIDMVEKYEKYGILPDENMVEEKIGDGINYFVLLKACFLEDIYNAIEKKANEKAQTTKEFADKIKECPQVYKNSTEEIEKFEKTRNKELERLINEPAAKTATEIKEQAAIANSMYENPRKRLVVEKLRKMLNPLFVWLTDNNRFVDYEKIKGMINKAELEADSVPDEFVKDVIVAIEKLDIPAAEWYQKRDKIITEIIQIMLRSKYKVGDTVWMIISDLKCKDWAVYKEMIIGDMFLFIDGKEIGCKGVFGEMLSENFCFKTREEAQQECDKRNKSEKDVKDIFDTASDLTTAMIVNKRKKAVVDNMQDKLKPIIEYLMITSIAEYQRFANLCVTEVKKHDSITDKVFYKAIIMFLKSLSLPNKEQLPQYKFKTLAEIRDVIVKQLKDDLTRM